MAKYSVREQIEILGDYSEFEIICKALVCNELVKCLFGICLMMFQHVSHSSYARHLTKLPSGYPEGSFVYNVFRTVRTFGGNPSCAFCFPDAFP